MAKRDRKGSKMSRDEIVSVEAETEMNTTSEVAEVEEAVEMEEIMKTEEAETVSIDESIDDSTIGGDEEILADSLEDSSEDSDEIEEKTRKSRGKRQAFYDCAANVILTTSIPERNLKIGDSALILDPIAVTMPGDEGEFDRAKAKAEAIDAFTSKYGVEPELINGPIYNMKGIASAPRKRETLNVTVAKQAAFISERGKAIHRFKDLDWNVLVNFTTRPDTVYVFYENLVDPKQAPKLAKDKAKFQKPTPKFLPISALRNVEKNASA